jgi:hypothetical protein
VDLVSEPHSGAFGSAPGSTLGRPLKRERDDEGFSTSRGKRQRTICTTNGNEAYGGKASSVGYSSRPRQIFGEGAFRNVFRGVYTKGENTGQECVFKVFKTGDVFESRFFAEDIKTVSKTKEIVSAFNQLNMVNIEWKQIRSVESAGRPYYSNNVTKAVQWERPVGWEALSCESLLSGAAGAGNLKVVHLNEPAVWQEVNPRPDGTHANVLVEPMIEGTFMKFNSNTGHTRGGSLMQALSHFSYHHTEGRELLCDLQGGRYDSCYVLTDPVVMSRTRQYGVTDLGIDGMSNFFHHHRCSEFCRPHWQKFSGPENLIPVKEGTSMESTEGAARPAFDAVDEVKRQLEILQAKINAAARND